MLSQPVAPAIQPLPAWDGALALEVRRAWV